MSAARRYEFDTVFSKEGVIVSGAAESPFVPRGEVTKLTEAAREAGLAAGRAENERLLAAAIDALRTETSNLSNRLYKELLEAQESIGALALAAARQIAGAALTAFGPDQAITLLNKALASASGAPRLLIRADPAVMAHIHGPLTDNATAQGFSDLLQFDASPGAPGIRIEWGAGALGIDPEGFAQRLQHMLSEHLATNAEEAS